MRAATPILRRAAAMAVLAAALLLSPAAGAADHCCGGYCDTCPCGAATPCICCDYNGTNSGNCVWWAWHEACCQWGDSLAWCGNANTWDNSARSHGYTVIGRPCADTVFVMDIGTYGHVGWVEDVNADGSFDTTEMSCFTYYGMHRNTRSASTDAVFILKSGLTSCPGTCECTAGESQTRDCGNCGSHTRTCRSDCQWGAWSDCTGQGACSPGATQDRACCDCGTETRTCRNDCSWGDYGACGGPDPGGGTQACETGECGPCADGFMRCVEGCLACTPAVEPVDELCDGVDNDCNCSVDDGRPETMGDPPPRYAARLEDLSYPHMMEPGAVVRAWAEFENAGTETWPAGDVWLGVSETAGDGSMSAFFVEGSWPAWDVVAVLSAEVSPGGRALFEFYLTVSADASGIIEETFQLMDPEGTFMACPSPMVDVAVAVEGGDTDGGGPDARSDARSDAEVLAAEGGCSCSMVLF